MNLQSNDYSNSMHSTAAGPKSEVSTRRGASTAGAACDSGERVLLLVLRGLYPTALQPLRTRGSTSSSGRPSSFRARRVLYVAAKVLASQCWGWLMMVVHRNPKE